jgi:hypothetical protein
LDGKVVKVKISTISPDKSNTDGYVKVLRIEFGIKKWKSCESKKKDYFY